MPLLAALLALAGTAPPPTARPSGWYERADGGLVLVAPGPTGGLRWLDFERAEFHALRAEPDGRRWSSDAGRLERAGEGAASPLRWAPREGSAVEARPAERPPYALEDVRFSSGEVELAAFVLAPPGDEPRPAAAIVQGSGDSDRDNVWAFTIADALARRGITVLFPDKRGCGASGGDWRAADLDALAEDALAGLALLRGRAETDPARAGLVGLSQGGVVAPLAAARSEEVRFVVSVSAAPVPLARQMRHELLNDLRREGLDEPSLARVLAVVERLESALREPSEARWRAYLELRERELAGPLRAAVEPLPASRDAWRVGWMGRVAFVDPLPAWRALDVPKLFVFGAEDERDNVPVRESVRLLEGLDDPRATVRVFEGSGHALDDPQGRWVRRDFLELVAGWVLALP